jgi:hypothetical protein
LTGPGRYSLDALLFRRQTAVIQSASWARSTAA